MRLLSVCALFILLVNYGNSQQPNNIVKPIKTGKVTISLIGKRITLNVVKLDGGKVRYALNTKNTKETSQDVWKIEKDCGNYTTCIYAGQQLHTKIRADPKSEVIQVNRVIADPDGQLMDCFELGDATEWFGGPQLRHQHWPIQHMYYEEVPYVPTHPENMALAERYWLSSKGIYVYVDERDPLFLDQNNHRSGQLCLIAKSKPPYRVRKSITLNYEIGVFQDARLAHEHVVAGKFGKPTGHPNERMVKHPVWSTWARYKAAINEKVVREFAKEILANKFNNSQLEIDDNWETCYGSAVFDPVKFPNIEKLLADLKKDGFRVTLWIHPFINENCRVAYKEALDKGYFVKNTEGEVHTIWWQGTAGAGAIDFTNPAAVQWWVARLNKLKGQGIDSFKFDAGEESFTPQSPALHGPEDLQPAIYTHNYTSNLAKHFDDSIEARVGWRTQQLPIFVRMIDKDTRWTWNNGLPTLVTTLLQMNLNGYVFVLPDMIGGNGYLNGSLTDTELPSKNIFVRWLQANVFMPALQYSFVPWDFDNETIAISKKFTVLHANISPTIMRLMQKSVDTGAPLNPPIWWVDPSNIQAHKINDEFLLGEEILVAPIVEEDMVSRDIYLPKGSWKDGNTNIIHNGPKWLSDYPAPLNTLPYFYKVK